MTENELKRCREEFCKWTAQDEKWESAAPLTAWAAAWQYQQKKIDELLSFAIAQDTVRLCENNPELNYKEQWQRSQKYFENLMKATLTKDKP